MITTSHQRAKQFSETLDSMAAEVETNMTNHIPVMSSAEELPCQIDVAGSATITTTDVPQQHVAVMAEGVLITEPVLGLRMLMSSRVSLCLCPSVSECEFTFRAVTVCDVKLNGYTVERVTVSSTQNQGRIVLHYLMYSW